MRAVIGLVLVVLVGGAAPADSPHPVPHPLPPPHGSIVLPLAPPEAGLPPGSSIPLPGPLPPGARVVVVPPGFYRPNPYDVWQTVSPDYTGHFRPRVLYDNGHFFYAADGRPYPFYPSSQLYYYRPFARP